jgi:hypothetical protein
MNNPLPISKEKPEFKEAAVYINSLPPVEQWVKIRTLLPPHVAVNTDNIWKWLGLKLHASFGNYKDPLPESGLTEALQQLIQDKHDEYELLSDLIPQAEPFLQQEVIARNLQIPWKKRSDILKGLAYEDCISGILLDLTSLTEDWTSHSERSRSNRMTIVSRFLLGELTEEEGAKLKEEWIREDAKLLRPSLKIEEECPLTRFCYFVFWKYRKHLPTYEAWAKSKPTDGQGQFAFINRELKRYPGRGKQR